MRVWGFDADPKKEENYAELRRIREHSEYRRASELLFDAGSMAGS